MKSKKKTKKYTIFALIFLILIIAGAAFLYANNRGNSKLEVSDSTKKAAEQSD